MSDAAFRRCVTAAIVAAGAAVYLGTLDGAWVWDDASSVLLHRHVQDPAKALQLFREDQHAFGRGQGNFYRPLVSLSFMGDFLLSYDPVRDADPALPYPNVRPTLFHVSNALWHILAALGVAVLLRRLGAPRFACAAVPLLFVVHPLHTEAVAYISGRADMMAGAFMMAGLCAACAPAPGLRAHAIALACFALALLSKESAMAFPVLLVLVGLARPAADRGPADPAARLWQHVLLPGLSVAVLAVYLALRATVLRFAEPEAAAAAPFVRRAVETLQSFWRYLELLFAPTGLHMERTLAGATAPTALAGLCALAAILAAGAWAWRAGHRRMAAGLLWFLASWLPISGLFPLNAPMAEHWMYVPMIGFWWALAEALALLPAGAPAHARNAAAYALGLLFAVLTVQRNEDWGSNERFFRSTLAHNPDSTRVQYNLAVTYQDLERNLPGARRHYEAMLARLPASAAGAPMADSAIEAHLSLGNVLIEQAQYVRAAAHFRAVLPLGQADAYRPQAAAALMGLGKCHLADGDIARAGSAFEQAVQLAPVYAGEVRALLSGAPIGRG